MFAQLILAVVLCSGAYWVWQNDRQQHKLLVHQMKDADDYLASLPPPPPRYHFPDGGHTLAPNYRLVALYGTPDAPVLGALGQQGLDQSIARAQKLARDYQPYSAEPVMPTLEIIATIASAGPTDNNDYSTQLPLAKLEPWIRQALAHNVYVVLDLQSGRSDFLSQAKALQPLLEYPNVGLALDPEWRLKPNQKPLVQIGSVSIHEVNETANWLANLTGRRHLPQKLFLLHEFRLSSLPSRVMLDTSRPQLAYVVQMDGQGPQSEKDHTWQQVITNAPANPRFGWKNFLKKDPVVLTPKQTMAIKPQPWYVSYQ
jgi:hypothetical protein